MLKNKKIVLGISGGIAAYKCAQLTRLLVKEGAEVKIVMTNAANDFVTAKTLSVLSRHEVITDFFDNGNNWNNHVHLAAWADLILMAPLTANTLAKMACGLCDSLLLAVYLSATCKVFVAPAMDLEMYSHPTVKANLKKLESFGNIVIPAETGELASGLIGEGRMAEPENILTFINDFYFEKGRLAGKKVLVNAGPTYEAIDPVRFIGNRSSGKMGYAIAEALAAEGAEVTLVSGPVSIQTYDTSIKVIKVESSTEMYDACLSLFNKMDAAVCVAAVADFRPVNSSSQKIKKDKTGTLNLELEPTKDILAELGKQKDKQILVGFALETNNVIDYAQKKLKAKNLDMVIANLASEGGGVFGGDKNKITIIDKDNKIFEFELKSKHEVAKDIVQKIAEQITK